LAVTRPGAGISTKKDSFTQLTGADKGKVWSRRTGGLYRGPEYLRDGLEMVVRSRRKGPSSPTRRGKGKGKGGRHFAKAARKDLQEKKETVNCQR